MFTSKSNRVSTIWVKQTSLTSLTIINFPWLIYLHFGCKVLTSVGLLFPHANPFPPFTLPIVIVLLFIHVFLIFCLFVFPWIYFLFIFFYILTCSCICKSNLYCWILIAQAQVIHKTALTKVVDNWLTALNSNQIVGTVFLDLSKAFDLVNNEILINKLIAYKFNESTISWFKSYLSNKFQQVHISGKLPRPEELKAGIPHGSLRPLLFLFQVNDLPLSLQFCTLDLFADDATQSSSDSSNCILTHSLNEDLINFKDWSNNNSMLLNVSKTKAMYVSRSCQILLYWK